MPTLQKKSQPRTGREKPKGNFALPSQEDIQASKSHVSKSRTLGGTTRAGNGETLQKRGRRHQEKACQSVRQSKPQGASSDSDNSFCNTYTIPYVHGPHPFVFDINVRTARTGSEMSQKVMKRVLLDTGSDLNLISASAHADLKTVVKASKCCIRSVAGESAVVGKTRLEWTFIAGEARERSKRLVFSDDFHVLSRKEVPLFDCILGRHWITAHRSVFLSLWTA